MQLRRVAVTNVRSYESGRVDVPPGTTLLVGDVGAGKTSLLYAIEMALFGTAEVDAAYLVRHGAGHAEVAVVFEDDAHRYEVRRRFRRVRRKGKETFEPEKTGFSVDGASTAYSVTELKQRVIELLGFPDNPNPQAHSDLWRWAVYVPQERMREILAAKPQDRLETVRKALGVERYRIAAENAAELASDLRRSAEARRREADLLRHFDEEFAEWTERGDALRAQRPGLLVERDRAHDAVGRARQGLAEIEGRIREKDADARERTTLERERHDAAERVDALGRHRADRSAELARRDEEAARAEALAAELEAARAELGRAEGALAGLRTAADRSAGALRRLAEARTHLAHAAARGAEAEAERTRGRAERDRAREELGAALADGPAKEPPAPTSETVAELEAAVERARADEARVLAELARAQAAARELDELLSAGRCPRCHQAVRPEEFSGHRAEADAELRQRERERRAAGDRVQALEDRRRSRERYERARERWREAERRRTAARERVAAGDEADRRAEARVAEAAEALRAAEREVAGLAPQEAADDALKAEIARAEARRRELADAAERTGRALERARAAAEAARAIRGELGRTDLELRAAETVVTARAVRIAELDAALSTRPALEAERAEAEARARAADAALAERDAERARLDVRLDEAVRRVAGAEQGRAERARLSAEAAATTVAATWVGKPFREALLRMEQRLLQHAQAAFERNFARYFQSLVDDPSLVACTDLAFTPAVAIDGEWTPAEALSGGERTSLALAFRLALAQVVRSMGGLRLDTLLLDEPTDGFSPEQVLRMGELLDELALPQVVLVSHEAQLAAIADRVIRVEKRDGRSALSGAVTPTAASD